MSRSSGGFHCLSAVVFMDFINGVTTVFEHELGLPESRRLLSSSCDSSGSHDVLINPASLLNPAQTIRCSASAASKALKPWRLTAVDVFRAFSGLFYPSAQWCGVMWFGSLTLLLMAESLLVGFQCIEVLDGSAVGSVFPVCSLSNGSLRVAHNHCCSQAWCEGPPILFPFSLHILLPLFNLLSFLIYALCCACISNISIS